MTSDPMEPGDLIQSNCKKCKKSTKHVIVGLVDGVPSKVQCTICKGNHNYRKEPAAKPVGKPKISTRSPEYQEWQAGSAVWNPEKATAYTIVGTFKKGEVVKHTTFGMGIVRGVVAPNRMVVLFETGEKLMVCGN